MATLIPKRTDDLAANVTNKGIVWQRTDLTAATVKAVVKFLILGTWASTGSLTANKESTGTAGTTAAGLVFGGYPSTGVQKYDGAAWTNSTALNTPSNCPGGCGTQTAALRMGGNSSGGLVVTETFDGAAWTNKNNMGTARWYAGSAGTIAAGLVFGGGAYLSTSEMFNGTDWAAGGSLSATKEGMCSGGTQTTAICGGGTNATQIAVTELYNGTTFSISGNLSEAKHALGGFGNSFDAVTSTGYSTGRMNTTEQFSQGVWRVGNTNSLTGRYWASGLGTALSGLIIGGNDTDGLDTAVVSKYTCANNYPLKTFTLS